MTAASHALAEIAGFWRVARRLYTIYAELDRTFELGMPPCVELDQNVDRSDSETLQRIRQWFQKADGLVQVWQIRQLLQSTNVQTEENLRYLILRHLDKEPKTESDREKIDFLLVQYFAHCAPPGVVDHPITLDQVARVLEPALGQIAGDFSGWTARLDEKLAKMNNSDSLKELQDSGGLVEAREMKTAAGDRYFEPVALVAFTRFNFLARRAFFRAMHLDLHAIRADVNQLEKLGFSSLDCRNAGLSENESLEQLRHVVHQWKTPFRAPYSARGESFHQLISLRQALQRKLGSTSTGQPAQDSAFAAQAAPEEEPASIRPTPEMVADAGPSPASEAQPSTQATPAILEPSPSRASPAAPVAPEAEPSTLATPVATPVSMPPPSATTAHESTEALASPPTPTVSPETANPGSAEEEDFLERCVADITNQLASVPPKITPSVSAIHLGGCKLLIARWEADAFKGNSEPLRALQRAVAARTILHVCMERFRRHEATDLDAAVEIGQRLAEEMKFQVQRARDSSNIDAAVNLSATAKRLIALVEEGQKLRA
jgi:hypothetical protein